MSSKLSASPRTAHTAITRMSSSRCSTFHSHLGSSTVSNAAIKVSSMASLRRKAEPLAGQAAEMEALISCVTPGTIYNQLFAALDWLPTFTEIAGGPKEDDLKKQLEQGAY